MGLVASLRKDKRLQSDGECEKHRGLEKLKVKRSVVPAITHVDYSARVQTVDCNRHGRFYSLIRRFKDKSDCPVIINTSFNIRGEPIVCSPEHAYRCFMATDMDVLVLEKNLLFREDQPKTEQNVVDMYLSEFELD